MEWECHSTPQRYVCRIKCPNFKEENLKIKIEDDGFLVISGEKQDQSIRSFSVKYCIPKDADKKQAKVFMYNGYLRH